MVCKQCQQENHGFNKKPEVIIFNQLTYTLILKTVSPSDLQKEL